MTALILVIAGFVFSYKVLKLFVEKPSGTSVDEGDDFEVVSSGFPIGFTRPEYDDEGGDDDRLA